MLVGPIVTHSARGVQVRSDRQAVAANTDRCAVCAAVQVVLVACSGIAAVWFASSTALSRSADTVLTSQKIPSFDMNQIK